MDAAGRAMKVFKMATKRHEKTQKEKDCFMMGVRSASKG
jgi:hypothetical protein